MKNEATTKKHAVVKKVDRETNERKGQYKKSKDSKFTVRKKFKPETIKLCKLCTINTKL